MTRDRRRSRPVGELVDAARTGDARAVARLISLVESGGPESAEVREIARLLAPYTGEAETIGITGSPGVGKSTLTSALVGAYRKQDRRVGVLAIDPTSPFSGGALLGDRVRMQEHATDPDVYIRSMATRGHLGGLAAATPQALRVLDAAGCSVIIVETVGVGQSEVDIAGLADTTLVLVAPGMGDAIQVAKAGILEVGDVYVVTKADREGAERVSRDLRHMLGLAQRDAGDWRPPIVLTDATTGKGVPELVEAVGRHRTYLTSGDELTRARTQQARAEIEALAFAALRAHAAKLPGDDRLDTLARRVVAGDLDPYTAADDLLGAVSARVGMP
ncbi:ArgK/MeaB family GTPase [Flindersiella endophytica]